MQMHHLGWTCLLAGTWTSLQMSPTSPATGLEMIQWHASQPCQLHHLLHGHAWRPSLHADHRVLGHTFAESLHSYGQVAVFSVHQRLHPPWRPRLRAPTLSFLMFHLAATLSLGRVFLAQLPHACKLMGKNIVRHRGHRSQGQGRCSRSQSKMRKCKCKQTVSSSIFALLALTAFFRLWMSIPPLGSRKNTPPYKNYSGSKACQGSLTRILSSLGFLAA